MVAGLLFTATSLWMMTWFTPQMDATLIVASGFIQGLGLGLVFVPLSTVAFATLAPEYRGDATSLFSLVRNIGSSIGISIVTVLLTHNVGVNHVELASTLSADNPNLAVLTNGGSGLAQYGELAIWQTLDGLVTIQALMIAYIDDFKAMMWITFGLAAGLLAAQAGGGQRPCPRSAYGLSADGLTGATPI